MPMHIEGLTIADREILRTRLIGTVFHVTTRSAYEQIRKTGEISNNQSARFPINIGSEKSYGRLFGHVCLFDLRDDKEEIIQNALDCYYFLGPTWFEKRRRKYSTWDLAYLFLDPGHDGGSGLYPCSPLTRLTIRLRNPLTERLSLSTRISRMTLPDQQLPRPASTSCNDRVLI